MTKNSNYPLFYIYFALFLFSTYIGREILSPVEHNFVPIYQIISVPILIYIAKISINTSRIIAGLCFFMLFVFFWDLSNYIPLIGLFLSAHLHSILGINISFDFSFTYFKYTVMALILFMLKNNIFLFFNLLLASKKVTVKKVKFKVNGNNNSYFSPETTVLFFNHLTQILTIAYKRKKNVRPYKVMHYTNKDNNHFFTPQKGSLNPSADNISIVEPLLLINIKNNKIVLLYKDLTQSMKKHIENIISDSEEPYTILETKKDGKYTTRLNTTEHTNESSNEPTVEALIPTLDNTVIQQEVETTNTITTNNEVEHKEINVKNNKYVDFDNNSVVIFK